MGFFKKLYKFLSGQTSSRQSASLNRELVANKWREIEELVSLGGPSRFKTAVMEADKLLDYVLRGKGFRGETMGDRLKSAQKSMNWDVYQMAWQAHKYRNRMVHEVETDVMHYEVKKQIENYRRAFKELGINL